ncbi:guanine nucleotide exchange factor [Aureococcus anophagefferens]|nr:guanine nucleotide exchange factor [Aureococcus anophagefferens]
MVEETTPVRRSSEIETRVGTRVDNALPRTWHRDLVFARTLLGSTPIGVLWLNRLQNGQRSQACYRLAVLSEYRLFVSNGKAGMVSGFTEHAHLFDLVKVEYKPGDRTVFAFRKLRVEVDDTVGTQLLSTLWRTLGAISAEVPPARLPQLDAGARRVVDDEQEERSERRDAAEVVASGDGFAAAYGAACDYFGVRARESVRPTPRRGEGNVGRHAHLRPRARSATARRSTGAASRMWTSRPSPSPCGTRRSSTPSRSTGARTPLATARRSAASAALLRALDASKTVSRVALVGCGLGGARLANLEVGGFRHLTELNVSDNGNLGGGLAKILGDGAAFGPDALRRLEARNCGQLRCLPLRPAWATSLVHVDVARSDLGKTGSEHLGDFLGRAQALETLCVAHTNLHFQAALEQVKGNVALHGKLRMVDCSLNKVPDDVRHGAGLGHVAKSCAKLERLALVKCELPLLALDCVLSGASNRSRDAQPVDLFLGDNAMAAKHGAVFFERLSPRSKANPAIPVRSLYLDRSHMGTLAIRDLCAALAASRAPHLKVLSLRCTASKGGMFANKKKHEEMARALGDVGDLVPAMAALEKNASIEVLDISNNACGDDALQALAFALPSNQTLLKLGLDGNGASPAALKALAEAMARNRSLVDMRVPERDAGLVATRGGDGDTAKRAIVAMKAALQRNAKTAASRDKAQGKETPADDAPKKRAAAAPAPAPDEVEIEAEASPAAPQSGDAEHRMKIFEEILSSETNYVRDLGVICHIFLAPIEKHELLSRGDIDRVFGNVRELRQIHTELLSKLRKAERARRDMAHATVFAEMVPFLRAYASYCGTYTAAVACVAALSETKPKLAKFLGKARQVPQCRGLDLASFLIKPPQRLCKYPLFFNDLLKHMGSGDAERESRRRISDTLKSVQDVTNRVNSMMAIEGSQNKVFEIWEQNLDKHDSVADLVTPSRRFLFEGVVDCASKDKSPKRHHFYLFNDLLLLATPKKSLVTGDRRVNKYKVKHRFALVELSRLKRSDSDDEADAADARDLEEVRDLARSTPNGGGWLASSTQQSPVVADPAASAPPRLSDAPAAPPPPPPAQRSPKPKPPPPPPKQPKAAAPKVTRMMEM